VEDDPVHTPRPDQQGIRRAGGPLEAVAGALDNEPQIALACEMMATGARGNPGGRGAPIVRSPGTTTQTLTEVKDIRDRAAGSCAALRSRPAGGRGSTAKLRIFPQPSRIQCAPQMTAWGHKERLPPSRLSGCCRFRQETFAGTHGNGRDAPFAAVPADHRKPGGSLRSGLSGLVTASDLLAACLRQRHPL